ncbi:endo-1,4-beta-xylanase [Haloterrigena salinisoli]|uniref:endo-1,4-beta-xylanase n=1 Tax=Haloterrigena salinisoli TaxID=3132747 RepID=UPI0030D49689
MTNDDRSSGPPDRLDSDRDDSARGPFDRLSRRGVLGGLGLAGLGTGLGVGLRRDEDTESDDGTDEGNTEPEAGGESEDSWETDADERIEDHRTTSLAVEVVDEDDAPIADAAVDVEMSGHAFGFGTAVNAEYLVAESVPDDEYRTAITDLFNKAVLENRHKWNFWELPEHREHAETATWWLLDRGLEMRGHACIWQRRGQGAIPDDVIRAMDEGDADHVDNRSDEHVSAIVSHHSGTENVTEWDVLNEQIGFHEMTDLIDPDEPPTRAPKIRDWFQLAADADPDARLYLNEYDVLAGDRDDHRDALEELVTWAGETDVPLDGIGMQSHHWKADQRRSPTELVSTLDRFAEHVDSIQITEYDAWGDEWTEELEAEYLYKFLKTVFSHPVVDGFVMWGFWDEIHWQGNAPLFREDWSKKPAYDAYTDLVFDQWWTEESGRTDADGLFSTDVFLGDHDVTVRAGDASETTHVTAADPTAEETVTVRIG